MYVSTHITCWDVYAKDQSEEDGRMKSSEEIRVDNLRTLVEKHGGVGNLAEKIHKAQPQVSHWLSGVKTISRKTARGIEESLQLDPNWMDQDYCPPPLPIIPPGDIPLSGPSEAEIDRSLPRLPPPSADQTIDGLLMSFSQKLANASPEVREQVIRLALIYVESPEQGGRVARAIRALLGEDG